ncbi:MAG: glycosyltransferase family 39 protein [Candidatus Dadabacteria bacterium]|nr:glycosyltransferase family 39 protein [Candidatus Dadabacteria bacterium]
MNKLPNIDTDLIIDFIRNNYLLLLIFLVGLFLRIYDLSSESIWYDEAISVAVAKLDLLAQVKWSFIQNDNNPPLYYTILHYWVWIFGDSEFASRLPSAIFGSFSIIAIYSVGRFLFNKNVGLLAALILATSVFHIKYSQEARAYSLLAFLTLVSYYFYLKIGSSKQRSYFVGYVISSILLLYTHYYGFLIIAAQNIFFFTEYFKNRKLNELDFRRWVKSQVLLFLLYLPGFVLLGKHTVAIQGGFWLPEPTLLGIFICIKKYSGSLSLLVLFLVFSLLSVVSLRHIKTKKSLKGLLKPFDNYSEKLTLSNINRVYLLLLWLLTPIILPYLLSLFSTPILLYRYTIGGSLAFYLLAARGIDNTGNRKVMFLIAGLVLIFSYFNLEKYYNSVDKHQWRETINYIEDNAENGDHIVVYPQFEIKSAYYYWKRKDLNVYALNDEFLLSTDIGKKNFWFVLGVHANTKKDDIEQVLGQRYDLLLQKKFKSLYLYQYRKKGSR